MATSDEAQDSGTDNGIELLEGLRRHILERLDNAVPNECIHLCGLSLLSIIAARPEDVLEQAKEQLHAYPYENVRKVVGRVGCLTKLALTQALSLRTDADQRELDFRDTC